MIIMIIVATVAMSGNSAFASQLEYLSVKDIKGLNNNANAILNSASSGNIGNGNAVSSFDADTNSISNGNALDSYSYIDSIPEGAPMSMNQTFAEPTTNLLSSSSSSSSSSSFPSSSSSPSDVMSEVVPSIASGSLQKAGSTDGNAIQPRSGPYFDQASSKNVTALLGKTAYLNCRVKNLGNKTTLHQVSWVRHRDVHLLTVGRYTYTTDQRFRAFHQPQTDDWILQIKYPQHHDTGIYECQVSTRPHMSHYIYLTVIEPSTEIIGAPDLYIESGSTINLTCVIHNSPEPPAFIFWNYNNAIIDYESPRGGISVVTHKGKTSTSLLLIKSARPSDSGLYQCNPSNAKSKSAMVHVLNGEFPAAMQRAALTYHRMSPSQYLSVCLSLRLSILAYVEHYMKSLPNKF